LKYHFTNDGASSTLVITKLHPDDSGKNVCKINEIETSAYLNVERKHYFHFFKLISIINLF
jgi:hypothetical protein